MLDFSQVKQIIAPFGEIIKIQNVIGDTLWQKIQRVLKEWRGLSPLTCTPTVAGEFEEIRVYGDSVQNPIRTRNLYDKDSTPLDAYVTGQGVFAHNTCKTFVIEVKPNTTYTLSYDNSMIGSNPRCYIIGFENKPAIGSTDATMYYMDTTQKKHIVTFTTGSNVNYIALWLVHTLATAGTQEALSTAQLEEGDTATPYVPYIATVPTPDTPIPVESVGDKTKNLFNENDEGIAYGRNINASGTESSSTISSSTYYIEVKPNTDYTIKFTSIFGGSVTRYHLYDTNKTWLQQIKTNTAGAPGGIETVNFTTTSDTQYLRFTIRGTSASEIENGKIQLEEGNTATSYEPYGYKVPVEVSGNLYKDTYLYAPSQCSFMSLKKGIYTMSVANDDSPSKGKAWYVRLYKDGNVVTERGHLTSPQGYMNFSTSSYSYYGLGDNYNTGISFIIDDDYDVQVGKLGADRTVELMVNVGATPLPYQPYTEPTTTNIYLNEPLRKVGEYADTLTVEGNNVTVVRNVEVIDETGTKTIEESLIHKIPSTTEIYTIDNPINAFDNTSIITVDTTTKPSEIYASEWVEE